jgi:hypothetical protein
MNEIAIRNTGMPDQHEIMVYHTVAEQAMTSKMYPTFKDKSSIMMIMLAARELGIPPMAALNGGLNIIQGKVEISARMMSALIRKSGHQIVVKECSENECILEGKRKDTGEIQNSSFSVAEAQKAGLVKVGGGWQKFPKDMCFARALSRLARQLFSDVIGIGYVEGEIGQPIEIKTSQLDEMNDSQQDDIQEVVIENEKEYIEKYLNLFDKDDKHYALEYLNIVKNHFQWTVIQAVKEVMTDQKKLFTQFNNWKNKFQKVSENEKI